MSQRVRIPFPLRPYTGGVSDASVTGASVGEVLTSLCTTFPGVRKHLYTENAKLRTSIHVFVNEREVSGLDHAVVSADTIEIVPALGGGGPGDRGGFRRPGRTGCSL